MVTTWKYDKRNRENLDKLSPNTKAAAYKWYNKCIELGAEVLIYETTRTLEQQKRNVAKGASQTLKSYHLEGIGQALDYVPIINGVDRWDTAAYLQGVWGQALQYAKNLGFTWGADWNNNGSTKDESFIDSPHLQFEYKGYGTDKVLEAPKQTLPPLASGIIGVVRIKVDGLYAVVEAGQGEIKLVKLEKGKLYNVTGNLHDYHRLIIDDKTQGWIRGDNGNNFDLVR